MFGVFFLWRLRASLCFNEVREADSVLVTYS